MQFEDTTTSNTDNHPLVPSISIQSKEDGSYFRLREEPNYGELDSFLSGLDIERKDIGVKDEYLMTLFQQEISACSWMKWSSLDHALEKLLQWLLLSAHDIGLETKESTWKRVRPAERSILLKSTWGLVKAYAVQGFVRGLELGLFTSIHVFIYSMLLYRLVKLIQIGSTSLEEFRISFIGSDQKGIDSLVRLLAGLEAQWLKLILTSPLIIGGLQSISSLWRARRISPTVLKDYTQAIDAHLQKEGGCLRDGIYEYLPGISSARILSLSGKLQTLESLVRWDGRISSEQRRQIFDALCRVVLEGKKSTQLNALQYLAKIAHGVGFKDLLRLKKAGYLTEELITILYTKGKALELLTTLSEVKESQPSRSQKIYSFPQRLYRQYLLWWLLGLKTHVLKQQLPALLLKAAKLAIEFYFFQMIVISILEAIRCPDKPGFELGFGYSQYANLFTIPCYLQMVSQFRSINISEPIQQLVDQTQYFNLLGLNKLILYYKHLTGNEMVALFQSAENRGASFTELNIYDYFADSDMQSLAVYLNTSKVQTIILGCYSGDLTGGLGLTDQGLLYLIQVLPFMNQLTVLNICFPNVADAGMESLANVLNISQINRLHIHHANMGDKGGTQLAKALATMPAIDRIVLEGSRIGDETVHALAAVVQNTPNLGELWVDGNFITNAGAIFFARMIQNSSLPRVGLSSTNITDEGVIALTDAIMTLPKLQVLGIGSRSGDEGIITLVAQLNKTNVWYFEIDFNVFTPLGMAALARVLPTTKITYLELDYNGNLNNPESLTQLAQGIAASSLDTLIIWGNNMTDSVALLGPIFSNPNFEDFEIQNSNLTDADLIALTSFLPNSSLQMLWLSSNQIGDDGMSALAKVLPDTKITSLQLLNNYITDKSAKTLADVYPTTALEVVYLMGNNISADILYQVENYQWQVYCQDQLCHANAQNNSSTATLTSSDSSPMRRRPTDRGRNHLKPSYRYGVFDSYVRKESSKEITWGEGSFIEIIDDDHQATTTDIRTYSVGFNSGDFLSNLTLSALPASISGESTQSLLTPTVAGAMIVGMVGLSLLLYKNFTFVRSAVNTSCRLLQNGFDRTRDVLNTASNFYSFLPLKTAARTAQPTDSHLTTTSSYH